MPVVVHSAARSLFAVSGPVGAYLRRTGFRVEGSAKRLCPVDTGRLRSSLHTTNPVSGSQGMKISIGTNVNYAGFVELGTRYMRERPYLRPALQQEVR